MNGMILSYTRKKFYAFTAWKLAKFSEQCKDEAVDATRIFKMVAMMHSKFATVARRCFHPPMIVKDADAIMRRTIKHLERTGNGLMQIGILRWKMYLA